MSRHAIILFVATAMAAPLHLFAADITLGAGIVVEPQQSGALPVSLVLPAPEGGIYVTLTTSDATILTVRPSTVLIPAGSTVPYSLPRVSGVNFGAAAVSASAFGLSGVSQSVRVSASLLGPAAIAIDRGITENIRFSLSAPAPSAATFTLSSDNPGVAAVPPAVTIPAGATVATIPVSGNAAGSTLVHVMGAILAVEKLIAVNVTAPGMIVLPSGVTVNEGQSATFPVSLSTPAPSLGVQVNFQSSDPARVTVVPSTVFIAAGAVSPASQPKVNGVNIGGALITATAPGYLQANQSVVVPATMSFLPSSLSLTLPTAGMLLLALSASAPWDIGLTVQLTSSNPAVATVQSTITFYPDGSAFTTLVIPVTPQGPGSAIITASAPPFIPATIASVTVGGATSLPASISVTAGSLQSAVVTSPFASPFSAIVRDGSGVPVSGVNVTFTPPSAGPGGTFSGVSTVVSNASGIATSPAFTANGAPGNYSVTATAEGVPQPAIFSLTNAPLALGALSLATSVSTGPLQSAVFPVSLTVPAPAAGIMIALSTSDASKATIAPASVFIAGGATSPAVQPQVTGVSFGSATISATAPGYSSASQSVQINGALSLTPTSLNLRGTGPQAIALTLSVPAPASGLVVSISSGNPAVVSVPPSVLFTSGASTVSVLVTAAGFGSTTITASSALVNVAGATASVTVQPSSDITLGSGLTVEPGQSAPLSVSLAVRAPAGGVYLGLTSSDPAVLDVWPSAVFIAEGSTEPARHPRVNGFRFGAATVSATAQGLAGDSQSVLVAAALLGPASTIVDRGTTQNITFAISAPAPSALTISLSSDNPAIASVPATVSIPANGTLALIPLTGIGAGSTVIHLGGPSLATSQAVSVTVVGAGAINLLSGVKVNQGQSAPYPVLLGSPAPPYGVSVRLTSSDSTRVTVSPAVVFVPAGAVTPAEQVQVNGINIGVAAITASAPGYLSASQDVAVPATASFSPASLTLTGSAQGKLLLVLSASAPWVTGITVNLTSSDPNVATVPATINFYPDGSEFTSIVLLVTPHGKGTTLIRASAPPFIPESIASVIVQ